MDIPPYVMIFTGLHTVGLGKGRWRLRPFLWARRTEERELTARIAEVEAELVEAKRNHRACSEEKMTLMVNILLLRPSNALLAPRIVGCQ